MTLDPHFNFGNTPSGPMGGFIGTPSMADIERHQRQIGTLMMATGKLADAVSKLTEVVHAINIRVAATEQRHLSDGSDRVNPTET